MSFRSNIDIEQLSRVGWEASWKRKVWFFLTLRQGSVGLGSQAEWLAVDWIGR